MSQANPEKTPDLHELAGRIRQSARRAGFDLVGIAPAAPSIYRQYLRQWLDDGRGGSMAYLAARFDERTDPARYLPGARSIICLAVNYHVPLAPAAEGAPRGRIARYALGDDYHGWMKAALYELADWLRRTVPHARTRCAVDSAPVMEKELAARAGIGWMGKNTCIINERIGSWLLLGEIVTDLDLPCDQPAIDRCGSCRRCIDACPTAAITAPYQLDARRCISYLTIEHRGAIDPSLQPKLGNWLFGCDICQEVCPWNARAPVAHLPALQPRFIDGTLDATEVATWTPQQYRSRLRGSAMRRVKLPMLQRNAAIVAANAAVTAPDKPPACRF